MTARSTRSRSRSVTASAAMTVMLLSSVPLGGERKPAGLEKILNKSIYWPCVANITTDELSFHLAPAWKSLRVGVLGRIGDLLSEPDRSRKHSEHQQGAAQ